MRYLFLISIMVHFLYADIDTLIESMQNVSDEKRFELMNRFKKEVIKLQEEERMEAMLKLISITESNNSKAVMEEIKANEQVSNNGEEVRENISEFEIEEDSHEVDEIEGEDDDK